MFVVPNTIQERIDELNALVEENPHVIPLHQLAKFLHVNVDSLRMAALQGGLPFDIHWENGSRESRVPTLCFYMWFMGKAFSGDFLLARAHGAI